MIRFLRYADLPPGSGSLAIKASEFAPTSAMVSGRFVSSAQGARVYLRAF